MRLFQILVSLSALVFSCTEAGLNISEIQLSWLTNTSMEIKLPKSTTDTIILTPASNIPGSDTPCLFAGKLEGDPGSLVAVSGCIDSNETALSISSMLLSGGLVDAVLVDGVTYSIEDDSKPNLIVMDADVVHATSRIKRQVPTESDNDFLIPPPNPNQVAASFVGTLPRRVILKTDIKYDNSLLGHFGGSHSNTKQWISRVVELAKPRMAHNSLTMLVTLKVGQMDHTNANLKATEQILRSLKPRKLTSYFCKDIGSGTTGITWRGAACRSDGYSVNINEMYTTSNSELNTAKTFAHELGHDLGMEHDHSRKHGGDNGACNGKGLMSYGSSRPDKWSQCSNADFTEWWRTEGYTCVESACRKLNNKNVICKDLNNKSCGRFFWGKTKSDDECREVCASRRKCNYYIWHKSGNVAHQQCWLIEGEGIITRNDGSTAAGNCNGNQCHEGWSKHKNGYGTKCYKLVTTLRTWESASRACKEQGGDLVGIPDTSTKDFIVKLGRSIQRTFILWVGGYDKPKEGTWRWIDGTPWGYKNWHSGEPNNHAGIEDCMVIDETGKWTDVQCGRRTHWYVCTKPL